jgi:hypothetical protein
MKVYSRLTMRRFWSITVLAAQVAFLLSPAWSQGLDMLCCEGATECHRSAYAMHAMHHCAVMHAQQGAGEVAVSSRMERGCPMDCCVPRNLPNATATASFSLIPPLAVTEAEFQFVPVTFTSNGFSSHTDRGPPAA